MCHKNLFLISCVIIIIIIINIIVIVIIILLVLFYPQVIAIVFLAKLYVSVGRRSTSKC